jgi:hypothetical protein
VKLDLTVENGCFVLGDQPGIGVTLDTAAIAALDWPVTSAPRHGPQIMAERAGLRLDSERPSIEVRD